MLFPRTVPQCYSCLYFSTNCSNLGSKKLLQRLPEKVTETVSKDALATLHLMYTILFSSRFSTKRAPWLCLRHQPCNYTLTSGTCHLPPEPFHLTVRIEENTTWAFVLFTLIPRVLQSFFTYLGSLQQYHGGHTDEQQARSEVCRLDKPQICPSATLVIQVPNKK